MDVGNDVDIGKDVGTAPNTFVGQHPVMQQRVDLLSIPKKPFGGFAFGPSKENGFGGFAFSPKIRFASHRHRCMFSILI